MRGDIGLARHPIDRDGPGRDALLDRCRAPLARDGMFDLDGVVRRAALARDMPGIPGKLGTEAFAHVRCHTICFEDHIPGLPPEHPARIKRETSNRTLRADQLGGTLVEALSRMPALPRFIADPMGLPALYPMGRPLAAFNVMRDRAGEGPGWHLDGSQFTITLLLAAPEACGAFEYRSGLRSAEDPNCPGVARLLRGGDPTCAG